MSLCFHVPSGFNHCLLTVYVGLLVPLQAANSLIKSQSAYVKKGAGSLVLFVFPVYVRCTHGAALLPQRANETTTTTPPPWFPPRKPSSILNQAGPAQDPRAHALG